MSQHDARRCVYGVIHSTSFTHIHAPHERTAGGTAYCVLRLTLVYFLLFCVFLDYFVVVVVFSFASVSLVSGRAHVFHVNFHSYTRNALTPKELI